MLGVGGSASEVVNAGWASNDGTLVQQHPDVVAARRCTVVEMLLQLQERLPRCVHIGHVLLGLSAHVGISSRVRAPDLVLVCVFVSLCVSSCMHVCACACLSGRLTRVAGAPARKVECSCFL
jgi:hypothetical protein